MAQLMPLPLTVSCFSKIQIGFTFLVPAYRCVCVCVCVCMRHGQCNGTVSVRRSVCPHVCPSYRRLQQRAAGLLLWARRGRNIDRLLYCRRASAKASSVTLSADVKCRRQTCLELRFWQRLKRYGYFYFPSL